MPLSLALQVDADCVVIGESVKVWDQLQVYAKRIQNHGHQAITESMRCVQPLFSCATRQCLLTPIILHRTAPQERG